MRRNFATVSCLVALALFLIALVGVVVHVCVDSNRELRELQGELTGYEGALAKARQAARETVKAKLHREAARTARQNAEKAAHLQEQAKKRRAQAKRIFMSRGFKATAGYLRSVEMPEGAPSAEDQEIIDLAGESASEYDLETAAEVLAAALKTEDPRARIAAVEMLSGLGEAGLVDISEFLADPHPDVANLAADRLSLGIQDLTDEKEQAAMAKVGFLAITDEDQLRSLGGTLMLVSDAKLAVDVLTEVICEGSSVQRNAAKEAYESVTGEKWVDVKTMEKWLAENYEPPEPEPDDVEQ